MDDFVYTCHLVVKGELLSCFDTSFCKECDSGQSLIQGVNEYIIHLQVWITLKKTTMYS